MNLLQEYLAEPGEVRRLDLLVKMKKPAAGGNPHIPLDLAFDLIALGLPIQEQEHILDIAAGWHTWAFEETLIDNLKLEYEPQALLFLQKWMQHSHHRKASEILQIFTGKHCSQRMRYVILMHSECFDGTELMGLVTELEGLGEYSDAFHALVLSEAIKYNFAHPKIKEIAQKYAGTFGEYPYPEGKSLLPALIYLAKTDPNYRLPSNASPGGLWREAMRLYDPEQNAVTPIDWSQIKEAGDLVRQWPVSTLRHTVSEKSVTNLLEFFAQSDFSNSIMRNLLSGLSPQGVNAAYLNLDPKQQKGLGPVARPWLGKTGFKAWQSIRDQGVTPFPIQKPSDRNRLFEFMYRNASSTGELKEGPWCCVGSVYQLQNDFQLSNLSRIARGTTGLYRQVFIKAFGAFKNQDKAVLQLLDYVHTDQISEQRAIVDALLEIASPRALQELLKFTGKAPFHPQLKMRIFRSLDQIDTKMVQTQIRDAIKELESKGEQTGLSKAEVTEALDLLRSRLQTESVALPNTSPSAAPPLPAKQEKAGSQNTAKQKRAKPGQAKVIKRAKQAAPTPIIQANAEVFDEARIAKVIPIFSELSGEVQRSLRTGIFFYDKVQQETAGTMDLSPVIDMQYKAMEVCLREAFQAATDILIREGVLQRKLDLLGYSRPIIEKMTRFENFISSLPIIKEIPYFSKFKLRKMLRGICQFRPGKRFTLDGLKAFALFFAVFSRGRCQYGLQNLFPLSFSEDEQLYAFVHQLHSFQDFRNRAVHEGLPPEASANLEKTWKQTSDILILICNLTNAARSIKEEEISKRTREPTFLKRNA